LQKPVSGCQQSFHHFRQSRVFKISALVVIKNSGSFGNLIRKRFGQFKSGFCVQTRFKFCAFQKQACGYNLAHWRWFWFLAKMPLQIAAVQQSVHLTLGILRTSQAFFTP
jgi:hypothetical protein